MSWLYQFFLGPRQPIWVSDLSNLTVFALVGSAAGLYKKMNCAEKRCWRIGRHPVTGTGHRTCHHHSTVEVHDRLFAEHAAKHPEQHELLNRKAPNAG